jgi:hypothetical protein
VLGASARALASSAARSVEARRRFPAGLLAIDYFGDADLASEFTRAPAGEWPDVSVVSVSRDLGLPRNTASLGRAALASEWSAVACAGGLENRPGLLRLLARRSAAGGRDGIILGNDAPTVAAVRDPFRLFAFLAEEGIPHAAVRRGGAQPASGPPPDLSLWLVKRIRSAGGSGVRPAVPGAPAPPGWFLQERLPGPIGSAAFLADGQAATLLGVTEQLAGSEALGAPPFRYAGNIAGPADAFLSSEALDLLGRVAGAIAQRFGLRGLNGVDYVIRRGVPHVIEVNPRWTASMELIEERLARNLFDRHVLALEGGVAAGPRGPDPIRIEALAAPGRFLGKGILYATAPCRAPDPAALEALGARDRPHAGEPIAPGQPVCTLVVEGDAPASCRARLEEKASAARSLLLPA